MYAFIAAVKLPVLNALFPSSLSASSASLNEYVPLAFGTGAWAFGFTLSPPLLCISAIEDGVSSVKSSELALAPCVVPILKLKCENMKIWIGCYV